MAIICKDMFNISLYETIFCLISEISPAFNVMCINLAGRRRTGNSEKPIATKICSNSFKVSRQFSNKSWTFLQCCRAGGVLSAALAWSGSFRLLTIASSTFDSDSISMPRTRMLSSTSPVLNMKLKRFVLSVTSPEAVDAIETGSILSYGERAWSGCEPRTNFKCE